MSSNRLPTTKERSTQSYGSTERTGGLRLTNDRRIYLEITIILQGTLNLLYISGGYDWIFRDPTVDTVAQTLSVIAAVTAVIFLRLLKDSD